MAMAKKQRKERNRTQHTEIYKRRGIDTRLREHLETIGVKDGKKQKEKGRANEKREREKRKLANLQGYDKRGKQQRTSEDGA